MDVLPGEPSRDEPLRELARQEKFDREMAAEQRKSYEQRRIERKAERENELRRICDKERRHYAAQRVIDKRRKWQQGRQRDVNRSWRKPRYGRTYEVSPIRQEAVATNELSGANEKEDRPRNDGQLQGERQNEEPVRNLQRSCQRNPINERQKVSHGREPQPLLEKQTKIKLAPARPGFRRMVNYSLFTRVILM
ncbi:hypothetical protein niasHS_004841 [Heterodera schachtii]|uniref:Uncharacterized protein n=1 Tax=Heterodera schachtii TaxID=97005 RepID=A0ABD2K110_HETSC